MSDIRAIVHRNVAQAFRASPRFRGKARIGVRIGKTIRAGGLAPITEVQLTDGSRIMLDPASPTEQWTVWTGEYDSAVVRHLARYLRPGDTVLDIGANVGLWSVQLARHTNALNGYLIAFEPVGSNFLRLQANIDLNQYRNVRLVNVALGDREGEVELSTERPHGVATGNAVIVQGDVETYLRPTDTARLAKLDTIADELNIASCRLMKIDVEGAETLVIQGAQRFLERHRPIIYGEFSRFWMRQLGSSFEEALAMLATHGYVAYSQTRSRGFVSAAHIREDEAGDMLLMPSGVPEA